MCKYSGKKLIIKISVKLLLHMRNYGNISLFWQKFVSLQRDY
jgi:hypothetical protein